MKAPTRGDLIFKGKERITLCFPRDWINYNFLFKYISENQPCAKKQGLKCFDRV